MSWGAVLPLSPAVPSAPTGRGKQRRVLQQDTCRILQLGNTDHLPEQLFFYMVSGTDADPF